MNARYRPLFVLLAMMLAMMLGCGPITIDSADTGQLTTSATTDDKGDNILTTSISAGFTSDSGESTSSSGGPAPSCCRAHAGSSCDDATVSTCVCAIDAVCCTEAWDSACVALALQRCDAACEAADTGTAATSTETEGETTTTTTTGGEAIGTEACCEVHDSVGCQDAEVEQCVCALDNFCCATSWDAQCVARTAECEVNCGSCCAELAEPSCADPDVAQCVCALDASCCSSAWNADCAALAKGSCGADCSDLDCCEIHPTPACSDPEVEACVCAEDNFCCTSTWDQICVNIANDSCSAMCSASV